MKPDFSEWDSALQDPDLACMSHTLGLNVPLTPRRWEWQLQCRLPWSTYQRFRSVREVSSAAGADSDSDPDKVHAAEKEFYAFVAAHPPLCRLLLEGRLDYYDALLPKVAAAVRAVPHARILDLGSFGGLGTLYLGRRFPDSTVVGVDRLAVAVRLADEFLARSGLANVTFVNDDYCNFRPESPFDVVVSLQTLPTYYLPFLQSASPESYARGCHLKAAADDPASPTCHVSRPLAAIRSLTGAHGHLVVHERIRGLARALLLHYLLSGAGFEAVRMTMAAWHSVGQRAELQLSPLILAAPATPPAPFDEAPMIGLYTPPPGHSDFAALPEGEILSWDGIEADANYHSLPGTRDELVVRAELKTGTPLHLYLGVLGDRLAYAFSCDTADGRKLTVSRLRNMQSLFDSATNELQGRHGKGDIVRVDPHPGQLPYATAQRFARYMP